MSLTSEAANNADANRIFDEAINLDLHSGNLSVCLVAINKTSETESERLETSPELANDFRDILQNFCDKAVEDQKTARAYAPDQKPNNECVQFVRFSDYPELRSRIENTLQPGTLHKFTNDGKFVQRLNYYAIVVQLDEGSTLVGLRNITPSQKPGRGKWSLKAVLDEVQNRYTKLENDPFLFDEDVDCLVYGDYVFIANRPKFEQIFSFDQKTREVASRALDRLQDFGIDNFDAFKKMCLRDQRKQRMLAPIEAPDSDLSHINVESAKEVIATNPQLGSILKTVGARDVLCFDPSKQWDLLRFLKQSTVRAVASGNPFEVEGDMRSL